MAELTVTSSCSPSFFFLFFFFLRVCEEGRRACVRSKSPPCVHSKRPCVCRHHAHMLKHMCAWCRYTQGRFESTHGGFSACHGTHHDHTTPTATATTTTTTTHNDTQPTKQHQPTNQRFYPVQHETTHQVKTRQGFTD